MRESIENPIAIDACWTKRSWEESDGRVIEDKFISLNQRDQDYLWADFQSSDLDDPNMDEAKRKAISIDGPFSSEHPEATAKFSEYLSRRFDQRHWADKLASTMPCGDEHEPF